jgi:N-acetylglucosamine-6-phosphate deacetylase
MQVFHDAIVVTPREVLDPGWVAVSGRKILSVGRGSRPAHLGGDGIDLEGCYLVPGFIDLHMHGGGGSQITTTDPEEILRVVDFHRGHGTTSTLVSLVSDELDLMVSCIEAIAEVVRSSPAARTVAGIHLEGPFLNPHKRGSHHSDFVLAPSLPGMRRLLAAGDGLVRVVTLAPELPGADELLREILAAGAVPSVGHTQATYEQATVAFDVGARLMTHLFNAMPPLHHRDVGAAGAALENQGVVCELINDGLHVRDPLVGIAVHAAGSDRIALVTDATPAAGMIDGEFRLGPVPVFARDGQVTMADGTLAGSTLTMDAAFRNTIRHSNIPAREAAIAAATTPARFLGISDRTGSIEGGKDADLVVLDSQLEVRAVYVGGEPVPVDTRVRRALSASPA